MKPASVPRDQAAYELVIEKHAAGLKTELTKAGWPSFDDEVLKRLVHGLFDAKNQNEEWSNLWTDATRRERLTFREIKDDFKTLHNGLTKIATGKGTPEVAYNMIKNALARIPPSDVEALHNCDPDLLSESHKPENVFKSIFKEWALSLADYPPEQRTARAEKLRIITANVLDNADGKGRGNNRSQAKIHNRGIEILVMWFEESQDRYKANSQNERPFNIYVAYWLREVMGWDKADPTRHIDNAINFIKQWEKISF